MREMLSNETRFVLYCCRTKINEEVILLIKKLLTQDIKWDEVFNFSKKHEIASLIYNTANTLDFVRTVIPDDIYQQLRNYYYMVIARNIKLWDEFCKIYDTFEKHGIRVIPLKGIILSETLYGNPAFRLFADIDILINKSDINRAKDKLKELGYTISDYSPGHQIAAIKNTLVVELHWLLLPPWLNRINTGNLWKRAKTYELDARRIPSLSLEDMLLFSSLQVRHDWPYIYIFRLCDINEILTQHKKNIDWDYIIYAAEEYGIKRTFYCGLYLCQELFDPTLPEKIAHALSRHIVKNKLLLDLLAKQLISALNNKNDRQQKSQAYLLKLLMLDSLVDCYKILKHKLCGALSA